MKEVKMIDIIKLQKEIHENAKGRGFYKEERTVEEFRILICSKVVKAFESCRNGEIEAKFKYHWDKQLSDSPKEKYGEVLYLGKPVGLGSKFADIIIRILDCREYFGDKRKIDYLDYNVDDSEILNYFDDLIQDLYRTSLSNPDILRFFLSDLTIVFARIMVLADHFNIDLDKEVLYKHEYNKTRKNIQL